jgi:hypothetical protein
MGGVGVRRLEASANHSSEKERTLPPRAAEIRSGCIVSRNQISRGRDCGVSKKMRPEFMDRSFSLSAIRYYGKLHGKYATLCLRQKERQGLHSPMVEERKVALIFSAATRVALTSSSLYSVSNDISRYLGIEIEVQFVSSKGIKVF